jgi:tetratricopeptide (TPR) repeat protein
MVSEKRLPSTLEEVEAALREAEGLRRKKHYREAIDLLVDALAAGLRKPQIYYRLGNVYFDSSDLDLAEYAYQRAITLDPDHANALHNLSVVYRKKGEVRKAVGLLRKSYARQLSPGGARGSLVRNRTQTQKRTGETTLLQRLLERKGRLLAAAILVALIIAFILTNKPF